MKFFPAYGGPRETLPGGVFPPSPSPSSSHHSSCGFFGNLKNPKNKALRDLSAREWAYLVPMVIVVVFMGVFPNPFLKRIEPSVELIRMDYLQKAKKSEYATTAFLDKPLLFLLPDEHLMSLPGTVTATVPTPAPAQPVASSVTAPPGPHAAPPVIRKLPSPPPRMKSPGAPPMVKPGGPLKPAQPEGGES